MGDVPPGLRTAGDIKSWFLKQYGLGEQELWSNCILGLILNLFEIFDIWFIPVLDTLKLVKLLLEF